MRWFHCTLQFTEKKEKNQSIDNSQYNVTKKKHFFLVKAVISSKTEHYHRCVHC